MADDQGVHMASPEMVQSDEHISRRSTQVAMGCLPGRFRKSAQS